MAAKRTKSGVLILPHEEIPVEELRKLSEAWGCDQQSEGTRFLSFKEAREFFEETWRKAFCAGQNYEADKLVEYLQSSKGKSK